MDVLWVSDDGVLLMCVDEHYLKCSLWRPFFDSH